MEKAFIKVMKPSVSIICFSIDRIMSIHGHKQMSMTSYVTEFAFIYVHALTNKIVPDTIYIIK